MEHSEAIKIIRNCFSHVEVERIVVEYDEFAGKDVAKVVVRDDQLDEALRDNGHQARLAAVRSGLDVEVTLSN